MIVIFDMKPIDEEMVITEFPVRVIIMVSRSEIHRD